MEHSPASSSSSAGRCSTAWAATSRAPASSKTRTPVAPRVTTSRKDVNIGTKRRASAGEARKKNGTTTGRKMGRQSREAEKTAMETRP